jgi:mono/diheme cytochrome c family protein
LLCAGAFCLKRISLNILFGGVFVHRSQILALRCASLVSALILSASFTPKAQSEAVPAELSFTTAQVANGKAEYETNCVDCHGAHLDDGEFGGPPLKGTVFTTKWLKLPVGGLVGYVQTAMPPDNAGRLPSGTYTEIVAYLLNQNGLAPGSKEMPSDISALTALRYPRQKVP